MGELLKGIKRNLLHNKKNSFNIGFSNRSPFSYQLPSADPNSGVTQVNPPDMNDGTVERIQAQADATSSMIDSFSNLASTAIKEEKKKYSDQDIAQQNLDRKTENLEKKKRRNITRDLNKNRADGDPRVKRKDITQDQIDEFDKKDNRDKLSESKKKRYGKLEGKIDTLKKDIEAGEYSDVSGRDLERIAEQKAAAEGKAATQLAKWQSEEANKETVLANANKKKTQTDIDWTTPTGITGTDGKPCTHTDIHFNWNGCKY